MIAQGYNDRPWSDARVDTSGPREESVRRLAEAVARLAVLRLLQQIAALDGCLFARRRGVQVLALEIQKAGAVKLVCPRFRDRVELPA